MGLCAGHKPSLITSALAARAVLFSLSLFFGDEPPVHQTRNHVAPT